MDRSKIKTVKEIVLAYNILCSRFEEIKNLTTANPIIRKNNITKHNTNAEAEMR